jgi:hypothetical protein
MKTKDKPKEKSILDDKVAVQRARAYLGGFSEFMLTSEYFVQYCGGSMFRPFGYYGSSGRTKWKDAMLERRLISLGLDLQKIVEWLTSGDGRHMMDDGGSIRSAVKFERHMKNYTANALENTTIWQNKAHEGSMRSTFSLRAKLYPWKYDAMGRFKQP